MKRFVLFILLFQPYMSTPLHPNKEQSDSHNAKTAPPHQTTNPSVPIKKICKPIDDPQQTPAEKESSVSTKSGFDYVSVDFGSISPSRRLRLYWPYLP
jgi:hypothetical protein